ncbi:MAG TPA: hypothetical protein VFI06_15990, partial [Chitinophagaceae bacterium]|nr:hypothetical protein [Chitinophagaceae bacterium]
MEKKITEAELHELGAVLLEEKDEEALQNSFENIIEESDAAVEYNPQEWEQIYHEIVSSKLGAPVVPMKPRQRWRWVAAAVLVLFAIGYWVVREIPTHQSGQAPTMATTDVKAPQSN